MGEFNRTKTHEKRDLQRLAVCAIDTGLCDKTKVQEGWDWEVLPFQTVDEIIVNMAQGRLDAVALPFDPLDQTAGSPFLRIAKNQKKGRPILVSYSTFNPSWIENLVSAVGSNLHLRGAIGIKDLIEKLESLALVTDNQGQQV